MSNNIDYERFLYRIKWMQATASLAVCVPVSRQIGNLSLLDGEGKMTEGGQGRGEGMRTSGSAE